MSDIDLETEIRKIIYDDYGVGHQNIESKEIYDKLVARGIDVPEWPVLSSRSRTVG